MSKKYDQGLCRAKNARAASHAFTLLRLHSRRNVAVGWEYSNPNPQRKTICKQRRLIGTVFGRVNA